MFQKFLAFYQKLTKRERLILYLMASVLGVLFIDKVIVGPVFDRMLRIERQIRDEETAIRKSLHVLIRKEQILAEAKQLSIFSVESRNPDEEMTFLLKEIEKIANESSVTLLYVKPGSTNQVDGSTQYQASLECEAQMRELSGFFHNIENSTRLLKVEKYDIQPKSKESSIARSVVTVSRTIVSK